MDGQSFCDGVEWSFAALIERGKRFRPIPRVSARADNITARLEEYSVSGVPLVIQDIQQHPKWPTEMFSPAWFRKYGQQGQILFMANCLSLLRWMTLRACCQRGKHTS